jgi:hypothetical protein
MKGDYCSYGGCGKKAIGFESRGTRMSINVCEDHASFALKHLKPGEKIGEPGSIKRDYHYRYPEE